MKSSLRSIFTCTCFIAGTAIGGGMLAMPLAAGMSGFYPSLGVMFLCCLFMALTGLLILEACLWFPPGAHFITLTSSLLGKKATQLCWFVYLFLAYASLIGYIADGARHVESLFTIEHSPLSYELGCVGITCFWGMIIFMGKKGLDSINNLFFVLMLLAYTALLFMGVQEVELSRLEYQQPQWAWVGIPLFIASFSYQSILPSLLYRFQGRPSDLKYAIFLGCFLIFLVYALWLFLIFGSLPHEGEYGLKQLFSKGLDVTESYQMVVGNPWVGAISRYFSFFAISTSFLGMSLGLVDFYQDGFKHVNWKLTKSNLIVLALLPSCLAASSYPGIFFQALDLSGSFGDSILNGFIPVAFMWVGITSLKKSYIVPWIGKKSLILLTLGAWIILLSGLAKQFFI